MAYILKNLIQKGKECGGDEGLELIPVSSIKVNGYKMLSLAKEVVIGYIEENTTGLNGTVKAMVIPGNGKMKKKDATFMVSSVNSQKSDLSMSRGTDGSVIAIWADSRKDENGIYGQRISIK